MSVTIAQVAAAGSKPVNSGSEKHRYVDITGPASYTTGGEALSASDLVALTEGGPANATTTLLVARIIHFDAEASTGGHTLVLDRTNKKIMYFNGTTQISGSTGLDTVTVRVRVTYGLAT